MAMHVATIPLTAGAVSQAGTIYTNEINFRQTTGHAAMFIISTAGSVSITQQCSVDGKNFYDPIDQNGNILGEICTALTVTTGKYIQFNPVIGLWVRFKIVENNVADTTVTLKLIFQENN
jgi:hypothetical protein